MMISDDRKEQQIIEILGIADEEENIQILKEWIQTAGLEEVYRKVIRIQKRSDEV